MRPPNQRTTSGKNDPNWDHTQIIEKIKKFNFWFSRCFSDKSWSRGEVAPILPLTEKIKFKSVLIWIHLSRKIVYLFSILFLNMQANNFLESSNFGDPKKHQPFSTAVYKKCDVLRILVWSSLSNKLLNPSCSF